MNWSGLFRVYWNTERDAPRVWGIDDGNPMHEVNVVCCEIHVPIVTRASIASQWPLPKGWVEGRGFVSIDENGRAQVTPLPESQMP